MTEFTLAIGNKNYSSWSLRAWLWMKHLGLEFDEVMIPLNSDDTDEKLGRYFSASKVPVLMHNDFEVWDSLAICLYLAELFPQKGLLEDRNARAVVHALCAEMHSSFVSLRSELPMNCRRTPSPVILSDDCLADIHRIEDLWRYASRYSDSPGGYLLGSFSMADAMFAPVVFRLDRYSVPVDDHAGRYIELMLQHPAMRDWLEAAMAETEVIESEER